MKVNHHINNGQGRVISKKVVNLLSHIEVILKSIKLNRQISDKDHKIKKLKFQFMIGRTVTRYKQTSDEYMVHPLNKNLFVRMSIVNERRKLSRKKIELYNISVKLLMRHNKEWCGKDEDFVLQVSCMDKDSFVKVHCDENDISTQHIITFGQYEGGILHVWNSKNKSYDAVLTDGSLLEFDGRKRHYVSPVTDGERYSLIFFKMYDRRLSK